MIKYAQRRTQFTQQIARRQYSSSTSLPKDWSLITTNTSTTLSQITKSPIHVFKHTPTGAQFVHIPTVDDSFAFCNSVVFNHTKIVQENHGLHSALVQYLLSSSLRNRFLQTDMASSLFDSKLMNLQSNYSVVTSSHEKSFKQFQAINSHLFVNGEESFNSQQFAQKIISSNGANIAGDYFSIAATKVALGSDLSGYIFKYLYEDTISQYIDQPIDLVELARTSPSDLVNFYRSQYIPNNSLLVAYGNQQLQDIVNNHLPYLSQEIFSSSPDTSSERSQTSLKHFNAPRKVTISIPPNPNEEGGDLPDIVVAYALSSNMTEYERFVLDVVSTFLLYYSADGPVLNQTLAQGLGSSFRADTSGSQSSLPYPCFMIGLAGVEPDRVDLVDQAIQNLFETIAMGHSNSRFELLFTALLNRMSIFENNIDQIVNESVTNMIYADGSKLITQFDKAKYCKQLQQEVAQRGVLPVLSDFIKKFFIGNNHRLTLIATKDPSMLNSIQSQLSSALRTSQSVVNNNQDTDKTPTVNKITQTDSLPTATAALVSCLPDFDQFFYNEQTSSGDIVRATVTLSCDNLEPKLLPLLPVLSSIIPLLGARETPRSEWMSRTINKYTSGVTSSYAVKYNRDRPSVVINLESSCLYQNVYKLMDTLNAFLLDSEIKTSKPSPQILELVPNLIRQQLSHNYHTLMMKHADILRLDSASSLSQFNVCSSVYGSNNLTIIIA
jgi:Zn-dependent M16 (insulinase) family peptidase